MLHAPASSFAVTALRHPTLSPSSCGHEDRLIIHRPECESFSFFDWSDFPLVHQQHPLEDISSCASLTTDSENCATSGYESHGLSPSASSESLPSAASTDSTEPSVSVSSHPRRVSFSNQIQVRTHSIVLGDHPCCKSLPLELGWEYSDENEWTLSERQHGPLRRRTYLERKDVLKLVSGMTDAEIKDLVTSRLHHVTTTSKNLCTMSAET